MQFREGYFDHQAWSIEFVRVNAPRDPAQWSVEFVPADAPRTELSGEAADLLADRPLAISVIDSDSRHTLHLETFILEVGVLALLREVRVRYRRQQAAFLRRGTRRIGRLTARQRHAIYRRLLQAIAAANMARSPEYPFSRPPRRTVEIYLQYYPWKTQRRSTPEDPAGEE